MLRRQIERAAEMGLEVRCATELEFYLFRDSYEEAARKHWRGLEPNSDTIEDYQLLQTSREENVLRRVRNEMLAAGIPIEHSKGEAGRWAARGEFHVRDGARDRRPAPRVQKRCEGDSRSVRAGCKLHGQMDHGRLGLFVSPAREPLGFTKRQTAHVGPRRARSSFGPRTDGSWQGCCTRRGDSPGCGLPT